MYVEVELFNTSRNPLLIGSMVLTQSMEVTRDKAGKTGRNPLLIGSMVLTAMKKYETKRIERGRNPLLIGSMVLTEFDNFERGHIEIESVAIPS